MKKWRCILVLALLATPSIAYSAMTADLGITQVDVYLSHTNPVDSTPTRIYATVHNNGTEDALGSVRFYKTNTGEQVGSDQPISLIPTRADDVFVDWQPSYGHHQLTAEIIPWSPETDDPRNNLVSIAVFVDQDYDGDGVGNIQDIDDDNDGTPDTEDLFPLNRAEAADTDGDGIGDNADTDDDNDEVLDAEDAFPFDPTETQDSDEDGIGDNTDDDDDNDGLKDIDEDVNQNGEVDRGETDPTSADSDNDGVDDGTDAFATDPTETSDFDGDGVGDNTDSDDDNDSVPDTVDTNSSNQGPIIAVGGVSRSVDVDNELVIDTSDSVDLDGEIVNTIILVQMIDPEIFELEMDILDDTDIDFSLDAPSPVDASTEAPTSPGVQGAKSSNTSGYSRIKSTGGGSSGVINTKTVYNEDGTIRLSSIDELMQLYFADPDIIPFELNEGNEFTLDFTSEENRNKLYQYIGENFKANFTNPGNYLITVIAQDDKNETRVEEIMVTVRDYNKIFTIFITALVILLAILIPLKYILRAPKRGKAKKKGKY